MEYVAADYGADMNVEPYGGLKDPTGSGTPQFKDKPQNKMKGAGGKAVPGLVTANELLERKLKNNQKNKFLTHFSKKPGTGSKTQRTHQPSTLLAKSQKQPNQVGSSQKSNQARGRGQQSRSRSRNAADAFSPAKPFSGKPTRSVSNNANNLAYAHTQSTEKKKQIQSNSFINQNPQLAGLMRDQENQSRLIDTLKS
jgi:hypothetical protein